LLEEWDIKYRSYAPDIVFGYASKSKSKVVSSKNILGISILNTKLNPEVKGDYIHKMAELVNMYLDRSLDKQVRLFGFDGGHENDGAVIDQILKIVQFPERVVKIEYNDKITITEYLDLFSECGFIVANRFHSMVLAAKFGIPFSPIIYSKKTSNVLNDIGYHLKSIKYKDIAKIDLDELLENINNGSNIFAMPETVSYESRKHFCGLDQLG
jgi:colanic acid/amylovoran biosynthesis protein